MAVTKKTTKNPAKKAAPKTASKKKAVAKKTYTCRTCGKTTNDQKHLCNPGKQLSKVYACDYCGALDVDPRHICKPKTVDLKYFCDACGRTATKKEPFMQAQNNKGMI